MNAISKIVRSSFHIIATEGIRIWFRKVWEKIKRREFQILELDEYSQGLDGQYQVWLRNNRLSSERLDAMREKADRFQYRPLISIIMPVYNTEKKWLSTAIESVSSQIYSNWELCIVDDGSTKRQTRKILQQYVDVDNRIKIQFLDQNFGISGASNKALEMATGEFVGFLDHDDELSKDALLEVVEMLNNNRELDLIYSDEDKLDVYDRKVEPFFKPDWSPYLLLSMNYITHFTIIRRNLIEEAGRFRLGFEGSQDYDLMLRITEMTNKIGHIPKPLYSWRKVPGSAAGEKEAKPYAREPAKRALKDALDKRHVAGQVLDGYVRYYRIKYDIQGQPLVSIIIPTKDKVKLLQRCIKTIQSKTSYKNYEIIIVDNNSTENETLTYFKSLPYKIIKFNEDFNFSKINNLGATYAKGEYLLFLNNDTEIIEEDWLGSMLEYAQQPNLGMVGALLLYPGQNSKGHRIIQHAGVVLGIGGVAGHAFKHLPFEESNYFNLHRVVRNCSAVTAACAMIRRKVFEEVGGFDENLKVAFGDIDLCLRIRKKGYSIIYTPYAMLYHHECATRGDLHPLEDEEYMLHQWRDTIIKGDPYYNPNLTLLKENYQLIPTSLESKPLTVLGEIYFFTPQLQKDYPEANEGNYQRLIHWVLKEGLTMPEFKPVLSPYRLWYESQILPNMENGLEKE